MGRRTNLKRSDEFDGDACVLLASSARADLNVDIHVERVEKTLKSLLTEARELPAHQIRHIRWRDAEHVSSTPLRPTLIFDHLSNQPCEFSFGQPLARIRE